MSRSYNKTSIYWENRKRDSELKISTPIAGSSSAPAQVPDISYESFGENIMASCAGGATNNIRQKMTNGFGVNGLDGFENLSTYPMPYEIGPGGRLNISRGIQLVMKAYTGFAVFRNAVEVLVEFSNTPMHLKGGNAKSRAFIQAWFNRVQMDKTKEQFFREYYRSGNVFLYRFDGKIKDSDFTRMKEVMGSTSNRLPIRYVILNPTNVFVENGVITNNFTYVKLLSAFEVERLKFPQTPEEQQMYDSLPDYVKSQIRNSSGVALNQIYIPIDPYRLHYAFYKKQDYEPLATPMGFGVLNDIEWKLQLKRMDMALTKTLEHATLLVTTGTEPEKGGVNPGNVRALQELFKNSTIGRVLVADWTTKMQYIIPDFKELLGPEKYTTVDKDIREGLQSILVGEDKFANAVIKARVFNERLKEGREVYVRDFLQPEINRVCAEMNFKAAPTVEFEEVSLEDDNNVHRLYTRWAELGLLAPWELMRAKETGLLPTKEDNIDSQKEYTDMRDKDLYYPLVGASAPADEAVAAPGSAGRPSGTKSKQTTKKVSPIGGGVSTSRLFEAINASTTLLDNVEKAFCKKLKVKTLEDTYKDLATSLAKSIMVNEDIGKWNECVGSYMETPKEMNKDFSKEVDEIRIEADVDEWKAILVNKCKITNKTVLE